MARRDGPIARRSSNFALTEPADVTAEVLTKQVRLPIDWADQEAVLGFV